jgi:hypothetical protein
VVVDCSYFLANNSCSLALHYNYPFDCSNIMSLIEVQRLLRFENIHMLVANQHVCTVVILEDEVILLHQHAGVTSADSDKVKPF